MYEIMMQPSGHRIDYINLAVSGTPKSLCLYVHGTLENVCGYSKQARHHLLSGLQWITRTVNLGNLVAVYMDISSKAELNRPARCQMFEDMQKGLFNRVVVHHQAELMDAVWDCVEQSSLNRLNSEVEIICTGDSFILSPLSQSLCSLVN